MALLSVKKRKEYLKFLGYYKGKINDVVDEELKKCYLKLQKDYFFNKEDKDGIYGPNTDMLLVDVYSVKKYTKNFDIKKDKMYCKCKGKYCTGYPAYLSVSLLKDLQSIRDKFGKTTITSMMRCQKWNDLQKGSVKNSKHIVGRAVDYRNKHTLTLKGRKKCIDYWFTLKNPNYSYCNGYYKTKNTSGKKVAKGMGISIHGDVKK